MNTAELINTLSKGNVDSFKLSPRQHAWLISVAKKEGLYEDAGHGQGIINMPDARRFKISTCSILASGGSYVGTKSTGNYKCNLYYYIKFTDTGITEFRSAVDVDRIRREKYLFDII